MLKRLFRAVVTRSRPGVLTVIEQDGHINVTIRPKESDQPVTLRLQVTGVGFTPGWRRRKRRQTKSTVRSDKQVE